MHKSNVNINNYKNSIKSIYKDLFGIYSECISNPNVSGFMLISYPLKIKLLQENLAYKYDLIIEEMNRFEANRNNAIKALNCINLNNNNDITITMYGYYSLAKMINNLTREHSNIINDDKIITILDECESLIYDCNAIIEDIKKEVKDSDNKNGSNEYDCLAKKTIIQMFEQQNVNVCSYLPEDLKLIIIKSLQKDLKVFNTMDIGELFIIGAETIKHLSYTTQNIKADHQNLILKRKKKDSE